MTKPIHINSKDHFQQEIAEGVSVIDFYADWCGPCQMLSPVMEELQAENLEKGVKILKVDVDENPDLASEFWVMSIPTVFFAKDGEVKEGMIGVNEKGTYQEKIEQYLGEWVDS